MTDEVKPDRMTDDELRSEISKLDDWVPTALRAIPDVIMRRLVAEALLRDHNTRQQPAVGEDAISKFISEQKPLGEPFQTILSENRWSLYARSDKQAVIAVGEDDADVSDTPEADIMLHALMAVWPERVTIVHPTRRATEISEAMYEEVKRRGWMLTNQAPIAEDKVREALRRLLVAADKNYPAHADFLAVKSAIAERENLKSTVDMNYGQIQHLRSENTNLSRLVDLIENECEVNMGNARRLQNRAKEDGHDSEDNHQDGRWHGNCDVLDFIRRQRKKLEAVIKAAEVK
jgi:hypothetical protein